MLSACGAPVFLVFLQIPQLDSCTGYRAEVSQVGAEITKKPKSVGSYLVIFREMKTPNYTDPKTPICVAYA